jgi:hypothetical protein
MNVFPLAAAAKIYAFFFPVPHISLSAEILDSEEDGTRFRVLCYWRSLMGQGMQSHLSCCLFHNQHTGYASSIWMVMRLV